MGLDEFLPEIFRVMSHTLFDLSLLTLLRQGVSLEVLITLRVLALYILKLFKFSALGRRLNLRRADLRNLIAVLHSSLNHDLLFFIIRCVQDTYPGNRH